MVSIRVVLSWTSLGVLWLLSPLHAEDRVTLGSLLIRAQQANPDMIRARQAWKAAQAGVSPAAAWPDPTFTYIDERDVSEMPGMDPMKMRTYRVEQMIPFPGKLTSESRMKYHEAIMAEAAYRAKALDVFKEVRMRYYQLALTDEKRALAAQTVETLRNVLKTSQARLGAGRASATDVFMAETELRRMENNLYQLDRERLLVGIELNTLLNQPTDTPIGRPEKVELKDIPVTLAEAQAVAKRNAPEYVNAEHELKHSKAQMTKSRLMWAPDFGVMATRSEAPEGGKPGRELGFSVSFPLWVTRPLGEVKMSREHLKEAEAGAQSMANMVMKMVHSEFVQTETHLAMARRYEAGVLPPAQSNVRIAREQYASGQGDFLRMLEAIRSWIEVQNMYQEEIYNYGEHWSELSRWLGVDAARAKEAVDQADWMLPENSHEK